VTDKLVRWTAVLAVLAVAAVAALISYRHAVDVVSAHGEAGILAYLYPVVVDGLIVAASMVLLDAARHREDAPALAWWMLAAGIGATLAVNVLAGVEAGPLGAIIASWPALAFVGCYELVMLLVRAAARRAEDEQDAPAPVIVPQALPDAVSSPPSGRRPTSSPDAPEDPPDKPADGEVLSPVPADAESAAAASFAATIAAGNPWSTSQLQKRFGLTRAQAVRVRKQVLPEPEKDAENEARRRVLAWEATHQPENVSADEVPAAAGPEPELADA
jgi:hypothetical protein